MTTFSMYTLFYKVKGYGQEEILAAISKRISNIWKLHNTFLLVEDEVIFYRNLFVDKSLLVVLATLHKKKN